MPAVYEANWVQCTDLMLHCPLPMHREYMQWLDEVQRFVQ